MSPEELENSFPDAFITDKQMIELGDGVKVAIYRFLPNELVSKNGKDTIVFIPGFIGYLENWAIIINKLVSLGFPVVVFETREKKSSSATDRSARFSIEGFLQDFKEVLETINLTRPFSIVGVSLGSGVAIEHAAYNKKQELTPRKMVLLDAIYESTQVNWLITVAKLPCQLFKLLINLAIKLAPILLWRIKKREEFTYKKILSNLKEADPYKMRWALLQSKNATIINDLPKVKNPTLVLGIPNDLEHPYEQSLTVAQEVQNGFFVNMENDEKLHSEQTAIIIADFLMEKSSFKNIS
ncbi:MAG: alpha/beta fold hydrolase [Candidatus Heimdallarchaeota archaeon]|nr:alpha/beta fold hydrolase [Candidatus Heimdallarchaeota archaeon]